MFIKLKKMKTVNEKKPGIRLCFLCGTTITKYQFVPKCNSHPGSVHNYCFSLFFQKPISEFDPKKCFLCKTFRDKEVVLPVPMLEIVSKIKETPIGCFVKNCKSKDLYFLPQKGFIDKKVFICEGHKIQKKDLLKKFESSKENIQAIIDLFFTPFAFHPGLISKFIPLTDLSSLPKPFVPFQVRSSAYYTFRTLSLQSKRNFSYKNLEMRLVGNAKKYVTLEDKIIRKDIYKSVFEEYTHPAVVVGLITAKTNPCCDVKNKSCGVFVTKSLPAKVIVLGEYKGIVQTKEEHLLANGDKDGYFFGVTEKGKKLGVNALTIRNEAVYANDFRNFSGKRHRRQNTLCVEIEIAGKNHIIWITAGYKIQKYSELLTDYGDNYWTVHKEYLTKQKCN